MIKEPEPRMVNIDLDQLPYISLKVSKYCGDQVLETVDVSVAGFNVEEAWQQFRRVLNYVDVKKSKQK